MSAWTTSRSGFGTRRVSLTWAPPCPCTPPRTVTAGWATSSPGTPARGKSSGRTRSSSRCGRARSRRRATSCYGTLEGYLKAVGAKTGKELYKFKTPSGIIGNVMTYTHKGKQYVAVLSGIGGWAGIGLAAGLTDPTAGLGAVGGYAALNNYTALGGQLTVFTLPQ